MTISTVFSPIWRFYTACSRIPTGRACYHRFQEQTWSEARGAHIPEANVGDLLRDTYAARRALRCELRAAADSGAGFQSVARAGRADPLGVARGHCDLPDTRRARRRALRRAQPACVRHGMRRCSVHRARAVGRFRGDPDNPVLRRIRLRLSASVVLDTDFARIPG